MASKDGTVTNNRVTNKALYDKIDEIHADISKYRIATEKRIVFLETCYPLVQKEIERVDKDVDTLKKRDYIVGGLTGVAAVIAGVLGINR